uniref:Uncharacterized protein n=1 Tax=Arundo donax TaxID=35708 RepID=A0A0A9D4B7_ARUDO
MNKILSRFVPKEFVHCSFFLCRRLELRKTPGCIRTLIAFFQRKADVQLASHHQLCAYKLDWTSCLRESASLMFLITSRQPHMAHIERNCQSCVKQRGLADRRGFSIYLWLQALADRRGLSMSTYCRL